MAKKKAKKNSKATKKKTTTKKNANKKTGKKAVKKKVAKKAPAKKKVTKKAPAKKKVAKKAPAKKKVAKKAPAKKKVTKKVPQKKKTVKKKTVPNKVTKKAAAKKASPPAPSAKTEAEPVKQAATPKKAEGKDPRPPKSPRKKVASIIGMMPQVGTMAPDFTAKATDGTKVSLSSYRYKKAIVLFFYPKDNTPGCTVESVAFNSNAAIFKSKGVVVMGVSPDDEKSHQRFIDKFNLNSITLLTDEEHDLCLKYGVWVEKNLYGRKYMGVQRSTFVIGKDGRIKSIWPNVKVDGHAEDVLSHI